MVRPRSGPAGQIQGCAARGANHGSAVNGPGRKPAANAPAAARLGRALLQRQPRRAARMRDRADRGPHQDRTADRARQHSRAQRQPCAGRSACSCRSDSTCRPAPNSRSMTARSSSCRSRPAKHRGCYASTPIAPDMLAALKSGKQLKVSFQNLGQGNHHHSDAAGRFCRRLRQDQVTDAAFGPRPFIALPFRRRRRRRRRASGRHAWRP